jgi:hypothetical protein
MRSDVALSEGLGPLDVDGFEVVPQVVSATIRDELLPAFHRLVGAAPGNRNGLSDRVVRALATSPAIRALVEPVLGPDGFAYRATLFDKTPTANWLVAWHQDLVVPAAERRDVPGYGPWSQKGDVWFVQPPVEVLRELLAVRIDLDGSDAANGALRVLPGTHRLGVMPPARCAKSVATIPSVICAVPVSGALLMRPLLVHPSSRAATTTHRRIVHGLPRSRSTSPHAARTPSSALVRTRDTGAMTPPSSAPPPFARGSPWTSARPATAEAGQAFQHFGALVV